MSLQIALNRIVVAAICVVVAGCGFRPLYATPDDAAGGFTHDVALANVAAPEAVKPDLSLALENRFRIKDGISPRYELHVNARERAGPLAVQIDATVTRYNYRLTGLYTLVDLETNKRISGAANAVTSYNIVRSQYSTLFAERAAQEKAARLLAEDIERDLLIKLAALREGDQPDDASFDAELDADTDILEEPRSGEAVGTRQEKQ